MSYIVIEIISGAEYATIVTDQDGKISYLKTVTMPNGSGRLSRRINRRIISEIKPSNKLLQTSQLL